MISLGTGTPLSASESWDPIGLILTVIALVALALIAIDQIRRRRRDE